MNQTSVKRRDHNQGAVVKNLLAIGQPAKEFWG